jgi:hypothetical protein
MSISVPNKEQDLIAFSLDLIDQCRVSVGHRSAYCRLMNVISETGRYDGTKSLLNLLYSHLTRTAAHIYSPVELRFALDFDREYPKNILDRGRIAAKQLTRHWDRSSTDTLFGRGVYECLKYGWCGLKQWVQTEGKDEHPAYYAKLVMPWSFGVYNEAENDISRQPAMVETATMTLPEVWRRIWWQPNAEALFERIRAHASKGQAIAEPQSFFHQVLSTSQLQTGLSGATRPMPGGIVQLNNDANYAIMGPTIAADTVQVHELWIQDDDDYVTILLVEPDVLISPPVVGGTMLKRSNLLGIPGVQPYRTIQVNEVSNWFWGRSELVDLIEPQGLLSQLCDDMKRLVGLQIDKILFFIGEGGITDEKYAAMRVAGYGNVEPNSQVQDVTPSFPTELMEVIQFTINEMNTMSGFPPIMQGQGEPGVRAGVHANTLLKTASPTLRDRSLIAERQCAIAADLTLTIKEAKDQRNYWTRAGNLEEIHKTSFLLADLPEDWRVTVDSHSSSPIFTDENTQLIMAGHSKGMVQTEYAIDNLPFPDRETAKAQNREAAVQKQQMIQNLMQQSPEVGEKVLTRMLTGAKR